MPSEELKKRRELNKKVKKWKLKFHLNKTPQNWNKIMETKAQAESRKEIETRKKYMAFY